MKQSSQPFIGAFLLVNNQLVSSQSFDFQKVELLRSAYEVLRVMQGKPLFLEDHLERFEHSIRFMGVDVKISGKEIAAGIQHLCIANNLSIGNVKLIFAASTDEPFFLIAFIPHKYPDREDYSRGITLKSLQLERPYPNAKIIHDNINARVSQLKSESGVDEILFVNQQGIMTEGSKSNIFFITSQEIITAEKSLVLAGITREKIIDICHENGMALEEGKPELKNLQDFSAAFITGTSPKVMPVRQINEITFNTAHPIILNLQKEYDKMIETYLG